MRIRKSYLAVLALFGVAACGGDDPLGVNSGDQLTPTEIQSLFDAMSAAFASGGVSPSAPATSSGISLAPIPVDQNFTFSAACPLGGTIGVSGSANGEIDDQTLAGDLSMSFTYQINGCVVSSSDITFTVNHNPAITFGADFVFTQDQMSIDGSQRGGFEFVSSDGRSGSCAIDLTFSASYNSGTQTSTASASGTVCGQSADQLTPFDIAG
jgi:hypothetical protein